MGLSLIRSRHERSKNQPLKQRTCQFPGCEVEFMGRGKTKYCDEHRKPEYRSQLYGRSATESVVNDIHGNPIPPLELNITIKHTYIEAIRMDRECDCCGKTYRIVVIPSQYVYPRYCEDHRNEWKRNAFIRANGGRGENRTAIQEFHNDQTPG